MPRCTPVSPPMVQNCRYQFINFLPVGTHYLAIKHAFHSILKKTWHYSTTSRYTVAWYPVIARAIKRTETSGWQRHLWSCGGSSVPGTGRTVCSGALLMQNDSNRWEYNENRCIYHPRVELNSYHTLPDFYCHQKRKFGNFQNLWSAGAVSGFPKIAILMRTS